MADSMVRDSPATWRSRRWAASCSASGAGSYSASTTTVERPGAVMSTSACWPGWAGKVRVFSERTLLPGIMARRTPPRALLALGSVWLGMTRSGGGVVDAGSIADSSRDVRGDAEGKP